MKGSLKPLTLTATANIQHSPAPRQINIKTHTESLTGSVPVTQYLCPAFNNNEKKYKI